VGVSFPMLSAMIELMVVLRLLWLVIICVCVIVALGFMATAFVVPKVAGVRG